MGIVFVAGSWAAWTAYMGLTHTFSVKTTLAATTQSVVGSTSSFTVTVTNTSGTDVKNFVIYVHPEGRDDWFKHHAVADSGVCVADPARGRFECGPIANGSTMTFTIQGTPTDAGTFYYALNYGDDRGGGDIASARGMWQEWTETISR